ncbi:MAG: cation-translocating P-type ATPase, partial [Minisyncoccales bacterium]
ALLELLKGGVLCNNSSLVRNKNYSIHGNPTEGALLVLGHKGGLRKEELEDIHPRKEEFLFTSERKMMTSINKNPDAGEDVSFVKGAPEIILEKCSHVKSSEKILKLDKKKEKEIKEKNKKYTNDALRVLAIAYKPKLKTNKKKDAENNLVFLGLVAMRDPPRKGVKETIQKCKRAGIKVKMVTGDNPETARAIARNIALSDNEEVITSEDLKKMDDKELSEKSLEIDIYARTMPKDKYRLVDSLQKHGEIVAMTGDGVNDAPAVKKADVGVGMGIKGTDVTKEASDIVLQDDNFKTLVTSVKEGRKMFDNIEKFSTYLVSGNFIQIIIAALGIAFLGFDFLPLLALQILFINVIGEEFPSISLGLEPAEEGIMKRKPRNSKVGILHKRNLIFIFLMAIFAGVIGFLVFLFSNPSENIEFARTITFVTVALIILVHTYNFRSLEKNVFKINPFSNKWVLLSIFVTLLVIIVSVYFSPVARFFSHIPLGYKPILIAVGASFAVLVFIEVIKKISNKYIDTSYMWNSS